MFPTLRHRFQIGNIHTRFSHLQNGSLTWFSNPVMRLNILQDKAGCPEEPQNERSHVLNIMSLRMSDRNHESESHCRSTAHMPDTPYWISWALVSHRLVLVVALKANSTSSHRGGKVLTAVMIVVVKNNPDSRGSIRSSAATALQCLQQRL